jgi:ribosomal protein S18 acetylase RimI-like enzyme
MDVTGEAYIAELVHRSRLAGVTEPIISAKYDSGEPNLVEHFLSKTRAIHEAGSRITALVVPDTNEVLGFSKLGPSDKMTIDDNDGTIAFPGGWYLNNIIVKPYVSVDPSSNGLWGRGRGSMLVHAALIANGCDDEDVVVLDAMQGNTVPNEWYARLGFVLSEKPTNTFDLSETVRIQQTYHAVLTGVLKQNLVQRHPWLASARRVQDMP